MTCCEEERQAILDAFLSYVAARSSWSREEESIATDRTASEQDVGASFEEVNKEIDDLLARIKDLEDDADELLGEAELRPEAAGLALGTVEGEREGIPDQRLRTAFEAARAAIYEIKHVVNELHRVREAEKRQRRLLLIAVAASIVLCSFGGFVGFRTVHSWFQHLFGRPEASAIATPTATLHSGPVSTPPASTPTTTPSPTHTPIPTPSSTPTLIDPETEARNAIQAVVEEFAEIKAYALRHLDDSQLETVLAGDALDAQRSSLTWLQENDAYWDITLHELVIDSVTLVNSTRASVLVTKVETGFLYVDGKLSEPSSYMRDTYQVSYDLEVIKGHWYITRKEAHESSATETPTSVSAVTPTASAVHGRMCFQPEFKGTAEIDHPLIRVRGYVFNRQGVGVRGVLVRIGAYDWSTEMRTWHNGYYHFDGLANAVEYMLSLPEYPCSGSQKVDMQFGTQARVDFKQAQ